MVKSRQSRIHRISFSIKENFSGVRCVSLNDPGRHSLKTQQGKRLKKELEQYFSYKRKKFSFFSLALSCFSPFGRRVLKATSGIPYGRTTTYSRIAKKAGKPKAARAVGNILNKNPYPVVIPCHRVIGKDGSLGGFACGTAIKRTLLEREGAV